LISYSSHLFISFPSRATPLQYGCRAVKSLSRRYASQCICRVLVPLLQTDCAVAKVEPHSLTGLPNSPCQKLRHFARSLRHEEMLRLSSTRLASSRNGCKVRLGNHPHTSVTPRSSRLLISEACATIESGIFVLWRIRMDFTNRKGSAPSRSLMIRLTRENGLMSMTILGSR
jgi:hypothetical protein